MTFERQPQIRNEQEKGIMNGLKTLKAKMNALLRRNEEYCRVEAVWLTPAEDNFRQLKRQRIRPSFSLEKINAFQFLQSFFCGMWKDSVLSPRLYVGFRSLF